MDFNVFLQDIVYTLIVCIVPVLTKHIISFLNQKIEMLKLDIDNVEVNEVIDNAERIVYNIVIAIQQTYVDSIKKAGEWNEETAKIAKEKAIETAESLIATSAKLIIEDIYSSFNKWLDIEIEKNVNRNK